MSKAVITVHSLAVSAFWIIGIILAVVDVVVAAPLAALSFANIAAGATLYVKGRLDQATEDWLEAYHAGREVARIRASS